MMRIVEALALPAAPGPSIFDARQTSAIEGGSARSAKVPSSQNGVTSHGARERGGRKERPDCRESMSEPGQERKRDGTPGQEQAQSANAGLLPLEQAHGFLALGESARIFIGG